MRSAVYGYTYREVQLYILLESDACLMRRALQGSVKCGTSADALELLFLA